MIDSSLKNANILIVDDKKANIDILAGFLEYQGYASIITTTDPRLAVSLFNSFKPDLILLDLMMPHLTGFEVIEQLKEVMEPGTYLPILVLTANLTVEAKQNALAAGARDFLVKPFDLTEVGLRIRNLLETRYLHEQLHHHNLILEERVKERTLELENTNISLVAAKEKAEASDRLKTEFIRNINHEIRTPLNGILGMYQILSDAELSQQEKAEYYTHLQSSSDRLIKTVTGFIDIALLLSGNTVVHESLIDPVLLIDEFYNNYKHVCSSRNLQFNIQCPALANSVQIKSDNEILRKILYHLIDNAIKFTSRGGVLLGFEIRENVLEFFVKDTGVGIEEKNRTSIFDHFVQENSSETRFYEGSGLGLSITSGLVKLLGGEMRLESEKGVGTTLFFTLPFEPGLGGIVEPTVVKETLSSNVQPVILITDDDILSRKFLESLVNEKASAIFHAKNGQEAVDQCLKHPEISLVLMDIKMPVMNGLDATREIRKFNKDVIIIAQTAYADQSVRDVAMEVGCNDFITKPVEKYLLSALIKHYFKMA